MTDAELTRALERGNLPNEGFHHADHLRVALVYLNESPSVEGGRRTDASTLRRFAASVGKAREVLASGDGVLDVSDGRGARADAVGRLRGAGSRVSAPAGQGSD